MNQEQTETVISEQGKTIHEMRQRLDKLETFVHRVMAPLLNELQNP